MSNLAMGDMLRFARERRAGRTPEAMLQSRVEAHREDLAQRARQAAGTVLQGMRQDQQTSDSLNNMVSQARPADPVLQHVAELQDTVDKLKKIRQESSQDLQKVSEDLEKEEGLKAEALKYVMQLRVALEKSREPNPYLPLVYQAGSNASAELTKKRDPNERLPQASAPVQRFFYDRSQDDGKQYIALEQRYETLSRSQVHRPSAPGSATDLPRRVQELARLATPRFDPNHRGNGNRFIQSP